MQPNAVDLWILLDKIIKVWNIKDLHYQVVKLQGLERLSLWQRLNSFVLKTRFLSDPPFLEWRNTENFEN